MCCSALFGSPGAPQKHVAVCYSVLQFLVMCCSAVGSHAAPQKSLACTLQYLHVSEEGYVYENMGLFEYGSL